MKTAENISVELEIEINSLKVHRENIFALIVKTTQGEMNEFNKLVKIQKRLDRAIANLEKTRTELFFI